MARQRCVVRARVALSACLTLGLTLGLALCPVLAPGPFVGPGRPVPGSGVEPLRGAAGAGPRSGLADSAPQLPLPSPDYVRLQVVAASDGPRDQEVKILAVQAVRQACGAGTLALVSAAEAQAYLAMRKPAIEAAVRDLLSVEGCGYGCLVETGVLPFPAKSYGGLVVPPGRYEALRVTLGVGLGSNWWCVLFPPLCFIDLSAGLAAGAVPPEAVQDLRRAFDGQSPVKTTVEIRSWLLDWLRGQGWLTTVAGCGPTGPQWPYGRDWQGAGQEPPAAPSLP